MSPNIFLLAFSILLIAKLTLGNIDCETTVFDICESSEQPADIPREVSEFNARCVIATSHLRCLKEYRDECGIDSLPSIFTPEKFEAIYNLISEFCEEGTLLNSVIGENLKCFNETFDKTRCRENADELLEPFITQLIENEDYEIMFSLSCLGKTLTADCVLRAISENCGKLAEEVILEILRRTNRLHHACSVEGAQSVLNELNNLDFSEDKKRAVTFLLERLVEEKNA